MNLRVLVLALACTVGLCAQHFSWQDACFKNPALPYCPGHDSAVRPAPPQKDTGPTGVVRNPGSILSAPVSGKAAPSVVTVGGVDWRFADPFADVIAGINFSRLAGSPVAIRVISQLGLKQDLSEAEIERILEGLSGVNQMAFSVRDNRTVVLVTGRVTESTISELPPGWKAVPVVGNALLLGQTDAVDQAAQRIATNATSSDLARSADQRQNESEFWAVRSAKSLGPQALSAGVKRFAMTISIQDRLTIEEAYEMNAIPDANARRAWPGNIAGAQIDGNVVHMRTAMEADDVQQKFGSIAASPLGQDLGSLVKTARYLPTRESPETVHSKPVIYGLDNGPKEVRQ